MFTNFFSCDCCYLFVEVWLWPIQSLVKGKNDCQLFQTMGRVQKKPLHPWARSYLGGGRSAAGQYSHLRGFFSSCSKPICLAQGSPKTDFMFTPNTIFHIVSHLCDHLDQAFHLKFVESMLSLFCLVLLKFNQNLTKSVSQRT